MIKKINLDDDNISEIIKIQKQAYKIESELINYDDIPPLKDNEITLKNCSEEFYGYYINNELAGIISYKIRNKTLDIHRLAINPKFFRKGISNELLSFIEKKNTDIKRIIVSTGEKNIPAINLYTKNGFNKLENIKLDKSLTITKFEKILNNIL